MAEDDAAHDCAHAPPPGSKIEERYLELSVTAQGPELVSSRNVFRLKCGRTGTVDEAGDLQLWRSEFPI